MRCWASRHRTRARGSDAAGAQVAHEIDEALAADQGLADLEPALGVLDPKRSMGELLPFSAST